jgi:hypothetical protein
VVVFIYGWISSDVPSAKILPSRIAMASTSEFDKSTVWILALTITRSAVSSDSCEQEEKIKIINNANNKLPLF